MIENMISVSICSRDKPIRWNNNNMNIYFVFRGSMTGIVNNSPAELAEGDLWVVNRGVPFYIENCSDNCIYVQLAMNMQAFNKHIPNIWTVYFKCGPEENDLSEKKLKDEIRAQLYKIVALMDKRRWSIRNENEILYACINILNNLKLGFTMLSKEAANEQFDRVWRVVDYMFDNCTRKLTLKEVAEQEFISEAYLSRVLKAQSGYNFEELLAYIRSECSIRYLLETDMSITSIAYECGFSAPRYYNAAFKKYYNCTPADYRKKVKTSYSRNPDRPSEGMQYEDGTDRETLFKLIKEYSADFSAKWITSYITIEPEALNYTNDSRVYRRDILKCTGEDLMTFDNIRMFKSCVERLGIKAVVLEKTGMTDEDILKSNVKHLGLSFCEKTEKYIDFKEIFSREGDRTALFYKYEILNNINADGVYEKDSIVAYKKESDIHIVLLNRRENSETNFNIRIEDKGEAAACAVKLVRVKMPEDYADIAGGRAVSLIAEPEIEYCVFEDMNAIDIKETVKENGICLIVISKLNG